MTFDAYIAGAIDGYAKGNLPPRAWFDEYFDFVQDQALRERLGEEFFSARYIYKVLEGLAVQSELQAAQVRLQVLQYASIYEAVVHHILFDLLPTEPRVQQLLVFQNLKKYSIPTEKETVLRAIVHDGRQFVPAYYATSHVSPAKVRFDDKAECARDLGLIDDAMCGDLIKIYEARNAIHLHAEIRKGIQWGLELSKMAYRRHRPLREQILSGLTAFAPESKG